MALPPHGPELCLGGVAASDPPQCGGVPVSNWDWAAVDGEETRNGTTWGVFHLVGTYDDEFTVTEVGPPEPSDDSFDWSEFDSLCEPPPEGWPVTAWSDNTDAVNGYVQAQPDYVRSWITYIKKPTDETDLGPFIFNVIFTGDADRHEAAIRELWSGPLCVVAQDVPSERDRGRIHAEVERDLEDMGLSIVWSDLGQVVEFGVVLDRDGAAQAAFDERYGPGVVVITSELRPVQK